MKRTDSSLSVIKRFIAHPTLDLSYPFHRLLLSLLDIKAATLLCNNVSLCFDFIHRNSQPINYICLLQYLVNHYTFSSTSLFSSPSGVISSNWFNEALLFSHPSMFIVYYISTGLYSPQNLYFLARFNIQLRDISLISSCIHHIKCNRLIHHKLV